MAVTPRLAAAGPPTESHTAPATGDQIKASWIVSFARFIDWPAGCFAQADSPIVLGVLGKDPFGDELEATLQGVTVKGRPLVIRRLAAGQEFKSCHLLFLSASEKRREREWLEPLKGLPVLTVGETDDFLAHGGVINFRLKDGAVRFDINLDAAQPAGLKISAQLLRVAVSVKGKYDKGPNER